MARQLLAAPTERIERFLYAVTQRRHSLTLAQTVPGCLNE
jgi:hypothetical protein